MTVTADLSVLHEVTLAWDLLGAATVTYTSSFTAGMDGWSNSPAGMSSNRVFVSGGLGWIMTTTSSGTAGSCYVKRTVTPVAATTDLLRVRAFVRLVSPASRPARVYITDQAGNGGTLATARYVGAGLVEVIADLPIVSATEVRIQIAKATGSTQVDVYVERITFTRTSPNGWNLTRTDANGTVVVADWITNPPNSSGILTLTDHTPALRGTVLYENHNLGGGGTLQTKTVTIASSGNAVVTDSAGNHYECAMMTHRVGRASNTELHRVIERADPLPALSVASSRAGVVGLRFTDEDAAYDVVDAVATGDVMALRVPNLNRLDLYFVTDGAGVEVEPVLNELEEPLWDLTLSVVEAKPLVYS